MPKIYIQRITKIIIILVMFLLSGIVLFNIYSQNSKADYENNVIEDSDAFLELLLNEDYVKAQEYSLGSIKYNLANSVPSNQNKFLININSNINSVNDEFAVVNSTIEVSGANYFNVDFLKLYLIKDNETYKVYRIEEEDPLLIEENNELDMELSEHIKVFKDYVLYLSENDFNKASKLLIGKARKAHIQTKDIIKNTKLIENPSNFNIEPLYVTENNVITRTSYMNNQNVVNNLISFYKTSEGWKIYNVSQIY